MHFLPKSVSTRLALAVLVALGLVVAAIVMTAICTTPDIDTLLSAQNGREPRHAAIRLCEISPYVVKALLAAEDREFYNHPGINPFAIIRAAIVDLRAGEPLQGGSTITEQLAKNLLPPQGKDYVQKLRQMQLALALEHRFTKAEILELYLNRVYFGSGAYGIDAAARRYFGKAPSELTLYQSALLIGLLKAPSRLNPVHAPEAANLRARTVLQEMQEAGFISLNSHGGAHSGCATRMAGSKAKATSRVAYAVFGLCRLSRPGSHLSRFPRNLNDWPVISHRPKDWRVP